MLGVPPPWAFVRPATEDDVAPVLTSLRDVVVDTAGGGRVQIATGTGFLASSVIVVDGVDVTTTYVSATEVQCTMPAHAAGTVAVTVRNGAAESGAVNVEYWSGAVETSCKLHAERPDYSVAGGAGTWVVRVGANLTSAGAPAPTDADGEPHFAGAGAGYLAGADISAIMTSTEGTLALIQAPTANETEIGGSPYANAVAISNAGNGTLGIWNANDGAGTKFFAAHVYDNAGGYKIAKSSGVDPVDGKMHSTIARWSYGSGELKLATDGTWSTPVALTSAGAGSFSGALYVGAQYTGANTYVGKVRAVLAFDTAISDALAAKIYAWSVQRYGVGEAA